VATAASFRNLFAHARKLMRERNLILLVKPFRLRANHASIITSQGIKKEPPD
jgi:hypothetical protein